MQLFAYTSSDNMESNDQIAEGSRVRSSTVTVSAPKFTSKMYTLTKQQQEQKMLMLTDDTYLPSLWAGLLRKPERSKLKAIAIFKEKQAKLAAERAAEDEIRRLAAEAARLLQEQEEEEKQRLKKEQELANKLAAEAAKNAKKKKKGKSKTKTSTSSSVVSNVTKKEDSVSVAEEIDNVQAVEEEEAAELEETVGNLKTIGLVMAHSRSLEFENGFQMISNYNVNILAALKFTVIDLNIERAKIALGQSYFSCDEIHYCHSLKKGLCNDYFKQKTPMCGLWQIVFESYKNVIYYFYALEYLTKIRINVKHSIRYEIKKLPEFDAKDVMHQHLGLYYNINLPILYPERSELAKLELEGLGIPTKRVSLPVSAIMYYSDAFNDGV